MFSSTLVSRYPTNAYLDHGAAPQPQCRLHDHALLYSVASIRPSLVRSPLRSCVSPFIHLTRIMTVLSRSYSKTGVINADVFASFTEHSHSSRLLLLNGAKVSGVWYIDSLGSLRFGYGPSVMMDNVLLSASNTECVGVILG